MSEKINGPFGSYDWGTPGALLNSLVRKENVPVNRVEHFRIGAADISEGSERVAFFKWFKGISTPCLQWVVPSARAYREPKVIVKNGISVPQFRPSLCVHGTPALEVDGEWATPALYYFLKGIFTNWMDDPRYTMHREAGAFFQGGYDRPNDNWFLIEFLNTRGVERFIEYVNEHYNPSDESYKDFL